MPINDTRISEKTDAAKQRGGNAQPDQDRTDYAGQASTSGEIILGIPLPASRQDADEDTGKQVDDYNENIPKAEQLRTPSSRERPFPSRLSGQKGALADQSTFTRADQISPYCSLSESTIRVQTTTTVPSAVSVSDG